METIDHPAHYGGDTVYEVIKVIEAWGLDKSYCLGNSIKYIARHLRKGTPLEDLRKARWYLDYEIQRLEALQHSPSGDPDPSFHGFAKSTVYTPI